MTPDESNLSDVPPVTNAYQGAYRNYVLASALLAAWQLIGIDTTNISIWGITLKSPKAIPLILTALVVYFGYATIIQWLECDRRRRADPVARIDNLVVHGIAVSALTVAIVQSLLKQQLVNILTRDEDAMELLLGFAATIIPVAVSLYDKRNPGRWHWRLILCLLSFSFFAASAVLTVRVSGSVAAIIAAVVGISIGVVLVAIVRLDQRMYEKVRSKTRAAAAGSKGAT